MDRPLFSVGNHKLGKDILVFNLNRGVTCPGRSPWCRENCYDKKSYRYPAVRPARDRNLAATMRDDFIDLAVAEIKKPRKTPIKGVRIHGAGDFYSLEYLQKWFEIARKCPEIQFKANTRSWMLPFWGKPDNLMLRYSVDKSTSRGTIILMKEFVDGFAYIEGSQPEGTRECRDLVDGFGCGFTSPNCDYCYTSKGDVYYHIH